MDDLRGIARNSPGRSRQIKAGVDRFGESGLGDVKKLRGSLDEWRLRIGDWRIRFEIDPDDGAIVVLRVLPRGRAYRD